MEKLEFKKEETEKTIKILGNLEITFQELSDKSNDTEVREILKRFSKDIGKEIEHNEDNLSEIELSIKQKRELKGGTTKNLKWK